jgi:ADP-ribose pyrophosphatase YjhB (NUDIX family)
MHMSDKPVYHPHLDERGRKVHLGRPSRASNLAQLAQPHTTVTFTPGPVQEQDLHGMPLASWEPVDIRAALWEEMATPMVPEPAYVLPAGMRAAAGAVVVEPDGRIWLVAPSNGFGGYQVTFPKGRVDQGTSLQATAIKEVWEESGLRVRLAAYLGDFARTQTYARFYVACRTGGHPGDMGWESQAVHLATVAEAYRLLNRSTDREVLDTFVASARTLPPL